MANTINVNKLKLMCTMKKLHLWTTFHKIFCIIFKEEDHLGIDIFLTFLKRMIMTQENIFINTKLLKVLYCFIP